jgi:hypothetical protein
MKKRQPKKVKGWCSVDPEGEFVWDQWSRTSALEWIALTHVEDLSRKKLESEGYKVIPVEIKEVPRAKKKK